MPQADELETTRPVPPAAAGEGGGMDAKAGRASVNAVDSGGQIGWAGNAAVRWCVGVLVAALVWGGVFQLTRFLLPSVKAQRTWSAADNTPIPGDFLFLMFPVDDSVPLYDSPGGKKVGVLKRALGNDYGELHDSQWIQVPADVKGEKSTYARLSDLRYLSSVVAGTAPPLPEGVSPASRVNYVGAFAKVYMARGPGENREVKYMVHQSRPEGLDREADIGGEGRYVTFSLKANQNRRQFYAKVTADKAIPLAIDRLSEGSRLYSATMRTIVAASTATLIAGLAMVAVGGLWQRRPTDLAAR